MNKRNQEISNSEAEKHFQNGYRLAWIEMNEPEAIIELKKALELQPDMAEAHEQIGSIHFHAKKPRLLDALNEFEETIRLSPKWSEGHFMFANTLMELKRYKDALHEYRIAAGLASDDARILIDLGYCLHKLKHYSQAVKAYHQGIALKPAYGEMGARMMLADTLKDAGRLKEAAIEWKIVANTEPVWDYEMKLPAEAKELLEKNTRTPINKKHRP